MSHIQKSFDRFNERLSTDLLDRARNQALSRNQDSRASRFEEESNKKKRDLVEKSKKSNVDEVMDLIGGELFGSKDIEIDRVNKMGGDAWISVNGPDATYKNGDRIQKIDMFNKTREDNQRVYGFTALLENGEEKDVPIKSIILGSRKQAIGLHKLKNWLSGMDSKFNIDYYTVKGIH